MLKRSSQVTKYVLFVDVYNKNSNKGLICVSLIDNTVYLQWILLFTMFIASVEHWIFQT